MRHTQKQSRINGGKELRNTHQRCILIINRVRQLKEEPYTQKEAEAAIGLTVDNGKRPEVEMDHDATEAIEAV